MPQNKGYLFSQRDQVKVDFDEIPLSEYPRPSLKRDSYLCLNGCYDLTWNKEETLPTSYDHKILVPFALESASSGVNYLVEPDDILYYHKHIVMPEGFQKENTILHFEGVDQYCEVYINGMIVASHMGGYTPFSVLLPFGIEKEFDLILKVKDVTDTSYHSRGKQVLDAQNGWFYSSSSGVYKPIWMESVGRYYIEDIQFTPDYDQKRVKVFVKTKEKGVATLYIHSKPYTIHTNENEYISLKEDFHPWSPSSPYLYSVKVIYENDQVLSYFGMRKIEIKEIDGKKRILLNEEPIFLSGLLDQGYYFVSNLTPRTYQDYLFDIQKSKELGFNCIRKHIKTELDLFYYYCDKEGMILIQDFPCGGESYSFVATVAPRLFTFLSEKNINYKNMKRENEEGRKEFERECREYLSMFHNHPSVLIYTIFNEGWGQFDSSRIYHELKEEDSFHLYDTASGWYDSDSDFYSIHSYSYPGMKRVDKKKRCFIFTEVGGITLRVEENTYFEGCFGHGYAKTKEELLLKLQDLYNNKLIPQIDKYGLNMIIYTQLADCETEQNGLYTYDRKVLKVDKEEMCKLNQNAYDALEKAVQKKGDSSWKEKKL